MGGREGERAGADSNTERGIIMIVQTASEGDAQFVITMDQHTSLAGKFARAFGNDEFEAVEPLDVVLYIVDHHDAGWVDLDKAAAVDPDTGLPYHLVNTPFEKIIRTSAASPEFNSRHHAYCGLLSSLHRIAGWRTRAAGTAEGGTGCGFAIGGLDQRRAFIPKLQTVAVF